MGYRLSRPWCWDVVPSTTRTGGKTMNVTGRIRCHRRFGQAEDNSHGTLRRIWKDIYGLPPVKAMVLGRCTQYNADGREDDG